MKTPPKLTDTILNKILEWDYDRQAQLLRSAQDKGQLYLLTPGILGPKIECLYLKMLNNPTNDPEIQNIALRNFFDSGIPPWQLSQADFSNHSQLLTQRNFDLLCGELAKGNYTALKTLDLFGCRVFNNQKWSFLNLFFSVNPPPLFKLTGLTSLFLDESNINDRQLQGLSQMKSLKELNLSKCNITENGLSVLSKLSELRSLSLCFCQLKKSFNLAFVSTKLRELRIMTAKGLEFQNKNLIGQMTRIRRLYLANIHNLTDHDFAEINTGLVELYLRNCRELTREGVVAVSKFTSLKTLELLGQSTNADFLENLTAMTSLRKLEVSIGIDFTEGEEHLPLRARNFEPITSLKQLTQLTLHASSAQAVSDGAKWIYSLPKIRHLEFFFCDITNEALSAISALTSLRTLTIHNAPRITPDLLEMIPGIPSLKALHLISTGCKETLDLTPYKEYTSQLKTLRIKNK